jgi:hypothetical protein
MPSEKGRIVAGDQKAIRRRFNVTRVSTGNVPTLSADLSGWHRAGRADE